MTARDQLKKKISVLLPQAASHQDELIDGITSVVKWLSLRSSQLVIYPLGFSCCKLSLWESGSWGRGHFGDRGNTALLLLSTCHYLATAAVFISRGYCLTICLHTTARYALSSILCRKIAYDYAVLSISLNKFVQFAMFLICVGEVPVRISVWTLAIPHHFQVIICYHLPIALHGLIFNRGYWQLVIDQN
jgi:hypothetical protein